MCFKEEIHQLTKKNAKQNFTSSTLSQVHSFGWGIKGGNWLKVKCWIASFPWRYIQYIYIYIYIYIYTHFFFILKVTFYSTRPRVQRGNTERPENLVICKVYCVGSFNPDEIEFAHTGLIDFCQLLHF